MASRGFFLKAALAGGAATVFSSQARADVPPPQPSPSPTAAAKPPSATASAMAQDMRRYDPKLTDENIQNIATQIDANAKAAGKLNPRNNRLKNSDEPVSQIRVKA
ncbi:MAG: hypothetical protein M3N19_05935 [Candidatus Eremiobacteraeota bacterium]|nr:hypothetical protein [Candidatus Eremiobacteraeota bacterium]